MLSATNFFQDQKDSDDDYDFNIIDKGFKKNDATTSIFGYGQERPNTTSSRSSNIHSSSSSSILHNSNRPHTARPMTAVSSAGFQSQTSASDNGLNRFLNRNNNGRDNLNSKQSVLPEIRCKQIERDVHHLLEESACLIEKDDIIKALEVAKECVKTEKMLSQYKESNSLRSSKPYLTYSVLFHLATVYEENDMLDDALETYANLIKEKKFAAFTGRIRINMGNIYYRQENYEQSIRMYRMALDQIPKDEKELCSKVYRSIGNSFVKIGKLREAIQSYDTIINFSPDLKSCFNLLLTYLRIGEIEKSKQTFIKIVLLASEKYTKLENRESPNSCDLIDKQSLEEAKSSHDFQNHTSNAVEMVHVASRLMVTTFLKEGEWVEGYRWVLNNLKAYFLHIACHIEIEQAIEHLRRNEYNAAIKILKSYENKETDLKVPAAINLSFVYFLEGNHSAADDYANISLNSNRYNPNALVNKGNIFFVLGEYDKAKELYLEAIGVDSDCTAAIFNVGLANIRLNLLDEALFSFEKLHSIIPNDPRVLYQVANINEQKENYSLAIKWFNILSVNLPSDPGVLSRLGNLHSKCNEQSQAFHFQYESFRNYPSNIDVVGWLAVWFVKHEMYEKSAVFFRSAAQIQPHEIKWRLMEATCHRRRGNLNKAYDLCCDIHMNNPENIECLKHLISLCKETNKPFDEYHKTLSQLEDEVAAKSH